MREQLERSGIDLARNRLAVLAYEALRQTPDLPSACDRLISVLTSGARPLMALMGLTEGQVRTAAMRYLQARAADMQGASQNEHDSQDGDDRAPAPSAPPASQPRAESQMRGDRRGVRAPATKISRAAAMRFANTGVLALAIGAGRRPVGQVTWGEVAHLYRLRAKDALGVAQEVVALNALRPFVPDDPKQLAIQVGADPRRAEIETALEGAMDRWRQLRRAMEARPIGDLESTLLDAVEGGSSEAVDAAR